MVDKLIEEVINNHNEKESSSSLEFFNELLEISREWDCFKLFKNEGDSDQDDHDEIKEWLYHSGRKVILLEKVRRALVFKGLDASRIKAELIALNKYLLNNNKNLKLYIKGN